MTWFTPELGPLYDGPGIPERPDTRARGHNIRLRGVEGQPGRVASNLFTTGDAGV